VPSLTKTLGVGLVAGAVGTAAMTLSQLVEQRLRDREGSAMPAQAAEEALDVEPRSGGG